MKKWKMAAVIVLCLFAATVTFSRCEVSVYAYSEEEIEAAKEWLSANGYSPTRAGAEQAYQDYLNGKWGPVGGSEETQAPSATTEALPEETSADAQAAAMMAESVKVVETTMEETTESVADETMTEEETMTMISSEEIESMSEVMSEESTVDITEEIGTEGSSEAEGNGGLIHVGRYDSIIVVLAAAACTAMGYFTYKYVKKEKKDGE